MRKWEYNNGYKKLQPERIKRKTLVVILILSLVACNTTEKADTHPTPIENEINKDISDGLSNIPAIELDLSGLPKTRYYAEKEHSSISFRTQHWEIVDLIGWFSDFDIVMYSDSSDFSDAVIYGRVNPLSVIMPNNKMAGSVRQYPYIDAEQYGDIAFLSDSMQLTGEGKYKLFGKMKMNGITKGIVFDVNFNGFAYPREKSICGFDVAGKINRNDFNVGGQDKLHSGRLIHDDTIFLNMSLRME